MTDEKKWMELAEKLADGNELADDDLGGFGGFQRIAKVVSAFRAVDRKASAQDSSEPLFQWGHLQVIERIGEGGFGEVYRAYDPVLDRQVALKLRHSDLGLDADNRAFIQEARCLARVRHPNVLAVHGANVEEGRVGLWMDLLEGQNLDQHIKASGPIDAKTALTLTADTASALSAVHASGLTHGDVKMSNIMVQAEGFILMDFGAGSDTNSPGGSPRAATPLGMAPELFAGERANPATDQYALGVTLFRVLSGRYPADADSVFELAQTHEKGQIPSLKSVCPQVPRGLARLVDGLLSREPADRPTAPETVRRVNWLLQAPMRRRRVAVIATIIGSLSLGILLAGWGYLDARRAEAQAVAASQETAAVNQFLAEVFRSARPGGSGKNTPIVEILEAAADRLQRALLDQPVARAQALHHVGETFFRMGVPGKALELLEQALTIRQQRLGPDHPDTLTTQAYVSRALSYLSRHEEAEALLFAGLEKAQTMPEQRRLREVYAIALGGIYSFRSDYQQAEKHIREALSLIDPEEQPENFYTMRRRLAQILSNQERFEESEPLIREGLAWSEKNYPRSNSTLGYRGLLANVLGQTGRAAEAEQLLRINLQQATDWLGQEDPFVINVNKTLVNVLYVLDRKEEALAINTKNIEVSRGLWGGDDWSTLQLMGNQANLMADLGQLEAAEALYLDQISRVDRVFSPDHHLGRDPRVVLTSIYLKRGKLEEGISLAERAIPMLARTQGPNDRLTLKARQLYGSLLLGLGDTEAARTELKQVLELARDNLGGQHAVTADTLKALAPLESDE